MNYTIKHFPENSDRIVYQSVEMFTVRINSKFHWLTS